MTKKGPLGTAELFYVKEQLKTKEVNEIAKDLDRPVVTIQREADKIEKESPSQVTAGEQMARRDGVTVMTENASSLADSRRRARAIPAKTRDCTTIIKND